MPSSFIVHRPKQESAAQRLQENGNASPSTRPQPRLSGHRRSAAQRLRSTLLFYAESWALVHYLMLGNPQRTAELMRHVELIQSGTDPDRAFSQAFSCTGETLLHELREHVSRPALPFVKMPLEGVDFDERTVVKPLTQTDALCTLGELIAHSDYESADVAREYFEAARDSDPDSACARSGLGYLADGRGDADMAKEHFGAALKQDPDNAQVLFRAGRTQLHRLQDAVFASDGDGDSDGDGPGASDSDVTREAFEAARQLLRRSLEIRPEAPCVWAVLGYSYSIDPDPPPGGIEVQQRAIRGRGPRWTLVANLAVIYVKEGKWQMGREIFETYLRPWREPRAYWRLESWLVDAELVHLETVIDAGQVCEAMAALERLAEITEHEESRGEVESRLEMLRPSEESGACNARAGGSGEVAG